MHTGTPIILAASSTGIPHTLDILRLLDQAFLDDSVKEIRIKLHPHSRLNIEDCQQVFKGAQPSYFHFVNRPISQLLSDVDLLVYSHRTVCLEALARGVPVLSVGPETCIELDTMRWFPELRRDTASPDELRREVQVILSMAASVKKNWIRDAIQVAVSVYAPVTPETINAFMTREDNRSE